MLQGLRTGACSSVSKAQRRDRIQTLLESFGILNQAATLVGTPIRKGISGGQKRRVSVASQLITCPKICFLDEPTSGLDSTASYEVISYVKELAVANNVRRIPVLVGDWTDASFAAHRHRKYPSAVDNHIPALQQIASFVKRQVLLLWARSSDIDLFRQYRAPHPVEHESRRVHSRHCQLRLLRCKGRQCRGTSAAYPGILVAVRRAEGRRQPNLAADRAPRAGQEEDHNGRTLPAKHCQYHLVTVAPLFHQELPRCCGVWHPHRHVSG